MTCNFTSLSTIFQSYQDNGQMINEKLCAMELCLQLRRFHLKQGLNSGRMKIKNRIVRAVC